MSDLISVVVAVYNVEEYLVQCIDSIVNQTYRNLEIICVDDCSTDGSLDILRRYEQEDERITVIHLDECSGCAARPRNTGMDIAHGKYIMFLDSDDFFELTMVEKMYECAEANQAELVMCNHYVYNDKLGQVNDNEWDGFKLLRDVMDKTFSYRDISRCLFEVLGMVAWDKLILRGVVVKHGVRFREFQANDDYNFMFDVYMKIERIRVLDERLMYYRTCRSDSQTNTSDICVLKRNLMGTVEAAKEVYNQVKRAGLYEELKITTQNCVLTSMYLWYRNIVIRLDAITGSQLLEDFYWKCSETYRELFQDDEIDECDVSEYARHFRKYLARGKYYMPVSYKLINVPADKSLNLVLYGAGHDGKEIYEKLAGEGRHKIVLWVDKNAAVMNDPRVQEPDAIKDIKNSEYDAVIITIYNRGISDEVREYLVSMGVDEDKIYGRW